MAYSQSKLKSNSDKAYPCFTPIWIADVFDKCVPMRTLLYVLFKHIIIPLTSSMGTPDSARILYNTSLLEVGIA
jgi:hypothetical protein